MSWVECKADSDYEIFTEYPYQIRRKSNKKIIKENKQYKNKDNSYVICTLNKKQYYKHRLIALQFIPNPDSEVYTVVDHIDRNPLNNDINNLRWTTQAENNKNKSYFKRISYEYIKELPEDVIPVKFYKGIEFENYYYSPSEDKFFYDNEINYRILHINTKSTGLQFINIIDINHKCRSIYVDKWKRDEGI